MRRGCGGVSLRRATRCGELYAEDNQTDKRRIPAVVALRARGVVWSRRNVATVARRGVQWLAAWRVAAAGLAAWRRGCGGVALGRNQTFGPGVEDDQTMSLLHTSPRLIERITMAALAYEGGRGAGPQLPHRSRSCSPSPGSAGRLVPRRQRWRGGVGIAGGTAWLVDRWGALVCMV